MTRLALLALILLPAPSRQQGPDDGVSVLE